MFILAHLSDPHLAPLPKPRWRELDRQALTGYINWRRRRRFIHDRAVLDKIVADLKAQGPTTSRSPAISSISRCAAEFARGRDWLQEPRRAARRQPRARQSRRLCAPARRATRRIGRPICAATTARAGFPYLRRRGPLALIGLSSAVPTAWFMATGRLGDAQLARLGEMLGALARRGCCSASC